VSTSLPQKRRPWLTVFFIAAVAFLSIAGVIRLTSAAFDDVCGNDSVVETISPNGQLKAVTFRRNCGATTDYSTHVSILPASRKLPNESGNVFVRNHEPALVVRWIDDQHLSISGGGASTSFKRLSEFKGVYITYE
jgi:hypothetical protein